MTGFGRILDDLNHGGVRYVVVGGIALIGHGVVRATRDVDAIADPSGENYSRLAAVLAGWSATRPDGSPLDLSAVAPGRSINTSTPHGELDFLAEPAPPLDYASLELRSEERTVDGTVARICSLADLVALKRMAGRERDLADLADLEAAHGTLPDARERDP